MGPELAPGVALPCYLGGMRLRPDSPLLRSQPGGIDAAANHDTICKEQRPELETRGTFVRSYVGRGGADGNGQKLDPVLAFHLGLEEK